MNNMSYEQRAVWLYPGVHKNNNLEFLCIVSGLKLTAITYCKGKLRVKINFTLQYYGNMAAFAHLWEQNLHKNTACSLYFNIEKCWYCSLRLCWFHICTKWVELPTHFCSVTSIHRSIILPTLHLMVPQGCARAYLQHTWGESKEYTLERLTVHHRKTHNSLSHIKAINLNVCFWTRGWQEACNSAVQSTIHPITMSPVQY